MTIDHKYWGGSDPRTCQHNGGQLQFGPDGYLYISSGDSYDYSVSQDLDSLLGKILRISPRPGPGGEPYTSPGTNPFAGVSGADEIWSYGVRNPWRFSFDRQTGDFILADVQDNTTEEFDYVPAPNAARGLNFGWSACEGWSVYGNTTPCNLAGATAPAYTYPHTDGRCAMMGGYVVRDYSLADLYGRYLFADLCTGQFYSAHLAAPATTDVQPTSLHATTPVTFGEDACGRVYVAELGGNVFRLKSESGGTCAAATTPPPETSPPTGTPPTETPPSGDPGTGDPGTGDGGTGGPGTGGSGGGSDPAVTCGGKTATVIGGGGKVKGTGHADVIVGDDDVDKISAGGGDDIVCAGDGDDSVSGGAGDDVLRGEAGADALTGNAGKDRCKGGPGKDKIKSC
jgi:Ca2+-binding RTX toxin-like protein